MAKKKKKKAGVSLAAFYNDVAKRADTAGLQLSVADTKRVLACCFDVLLDRPPSMAFDLMAKGLTRAERRRPAP